MKTPRFFIVLGACALLMNFAMISKEALVRTCSASELPILHFDPRAGDPEEPGFWKSMPFDEDGEYVRLEVPLETTRERVDQLGRIENARWSIGDRFFRLVDLLFGRRR